MIQRAFGDGCDDELVVSGLPRRHLTFKGSLFLVSHEDILSSWLASRAHEHAGQESPMRMVFNAAPEGSSVFSPGCSVSKHYKVHIHPDAGSQKKKPRTDLWNSSAAKKQGDVVVEVCLHAKV
ncbi:UNVERIFIED_CONTAM: hypothetical protein K2H54_071857 [Gekko kuhli]